MMYVITGDKVMSDWYYDTKWDIGYNILVENKKN